MYSSLSDIEKDIDRDLIIQLTNDENRSVEDISFSDPSDPVIGRINEAISDADDEINGYLRSLYSLPLETVPKRIKKLSKGIAIYNIYKRRHRLDMPQSLIDDYKNMVRELEKMQQGKIQLEIEMMTSVEGSGNLRSNKSSSDRIFSKDKLSSY